MWTKCMWKKLYGNINYIRIRIWNFYSFILLFISSLSFLIMIDKLSLLRKLAVNMSYSQKHMKCLLTATFHEAIEILKKNDILKTHPGNHKCQMGWKWPDCDQSIFKLSPQRNLSLEGAGVRSGPCEGESAWGLPSPASPLLPHSQGPGLWAGTEPNLCVCVPSEPASSNLDGRRTT